MIASHQLERKKQCLKIWFTSRIGCSTVMLSVYIMQCIVLRLKNKFHCALATMMLLLQALEHYTLLWNILFGLQEKYPGIHLKKYLYCNFQIFQNRVDQQLNIIFINERLKPFVECVKYLISHPSKHAGLSLLMAILFANLTVFYHPLKKQKTKHSIPHLLHPLAMFYRDRMRTKKNKGELKILCKVFTLPSVQASIFLPHKTVQ